MSKIKDIPKFDQPREKALFYGLTKLSNAELLALIISYGTKDNSALDVSYELLSKFNGINGIINASLSELMEIKGISKVKGLRIQAAILLYERAIQEKLTNNINLQGRENIAKYFKQKVHGLVQEKAYIVIVNGHNSVLSIKELFVGTTYNLNISPRLIIREVMDKGNRFYIIHNHPSNICEPSDDDRLTTSKIEMLAYSFGIELIDHLIITSDAYFSIVENKKIMYQ